jgi:predicted phage terminase large subunit-like protein
MPKGIPGVTRTAGIDVAAATILQDRRKTREKLTLYCKKVYEDFQCPWHLELLAKYLEAVSKRDLNRLMIFMPPRHGKSQMCSVLWPSWHLGHNPQDQIIEASYSESLAISFSRACRDTVKSNQYQELWRHRLKTEGAVRWQIAGKRNLRDNYLAAGVGGPLSGEGADLLIIDDPIKNAEQAMSIVYRDKVWEWYKLVARTRLQPKAAVVLIMTRWHEDDLAGRLLKLSEEDPSADQWTVLRLPSENPEARDAIPDAVRAYTALWPDRYPETELAKLRGSLGSLGYAALYGQQPKNKEGNIIKRDWFKFYLRHEQPEKFDQMIQSWDMSFKDTQDSSFVVGQVWGRIRADKFLLSQVRRRMDFPATCKAIAKLSSEWPEAHLKLVEAKANGPAVVAALKHDISGLKEVEPQGSKEARLSAASPDFESGNVYVPDPSEPHARWVRDYIEELCTFPNGLNDDQCDATSQAINRLRAYHSAFFDWLENKYKAQHRDPKGQPLTPGEVSTVHPAADNRLTRPTIIN